MADVPERNRREAEIAAPIGKLFADVIATQSISFSGLEMGIRKALRPSLENTFAVMYLLLLGDSEPDVNTSSAMQDVAPHASDYADTRSRQVAAETVATMRGRLADGKDPAKVFTQSLADGIAITETTRASSAGEARAKQDLENGASTALILLFMMNDLTMTRGTTKDGKVIPRDSNATDATAATTLTKRDVVETWVIEDNDACPICFPLDGTGRATWGEEFPDGPPAHRHCRCRKRHDVVRTN
ncbi:MAG: hypothetical protein HN975_02090 [Anaerolineae bacterium]|jgi:hypothetical protein|nr:hypothetical protein [Anaerolineae bacterium]